MKDMEYSKPMVTIELAEYEKLKQIEKASSDNQHFKFDDKVHIQVGDSLSMSGIGLTHDDGRLIKIEENNKIIRHCFQGTKFIVIITKEKNGLDA